MDSHRIVIKPLHTEKSVNDMNDANTYHFEVNPRASKMQIRRAIEELFPGCKVDEVRTLRVRGKSRRVGYSMGETKARKKAMVRLKAGHSIDIGY